MNRQDTVKVVAAVRTAWPHSNLGDDPTAVVDFWHGMLEQFDVEDVMACVREQAASGTPHAPLVGQIVKTLAERALDAPDFDEAWREMDRVMRRVPAGQVPPESAFSDPLIAAWARPAWNELRMGPAAGTAGFGTHYAQQREAYAAMRARGQRATALNAVGAPRRRQQLDRFRPQLPGAPLRLVPSNDRGET